MMKHKKLLTILLLFVAVPVAIQITGCASSNNEGELLANKPPRVWLSSAPPEGSVSNYSIHLYWGGWDPDGEIAYYEYKITDNSDGPFNPADTVGAWDRVFSNDSSFTFTADSLTYPGTTDMVSEFVRTHTFFVRAVDTEGLASIDPAYRSFTARTLSPNVQIEIPRRNQFNAASIPPISAFSWVAGDYIYDRTTAQEPDSVQWALVDVDEFNNYDDAIDYLRKRPSVLAAYGRTKKESDAEWYPWIWYQAPNDSGKSWTTPPLDYGPYVFAIRAKDEAGAITPVLDEIYNVRRVLVSARKSGPKMWVYNQYMGRTLATNCDMPSLFIDLPASVAIDFEITVDASEYGGVVAGYRYGWDIQDLDVPEEWDTDFLPMTGTRAYIPQRTFFFGTHTFTVESVDNNGFCTRQEVKVNIVRFTMGKNLLYVDDFNASIQTAGWFHPIGKGVNPSDAEHDAFWVRMLDNVGGFSPLRDMEQVRGGGSIELTKMADYKSIIWEVDSNVDNSVGLPLMYEYVLHRSKNVQAGGGSGQTGRVKPNLLALYMAAGGHLFICGRQPISNVVSRTFPALRYPAIILYEIEGNQSGTPNIANPPGDRNFGYREMCVDVLDYAAMHNGRIRRGLTLNCSLGIRDRKLTNDGYRSVVTMREAIPIDPNFLRLHFHDLAAGYGKFYEASKQGLDAEIYNPRYFALQCQWARNTYRDCFRPIYGLHCLDQNEPTYGEPIAFWTDAYANRRNLDAPDAIAAPSVVWGFSPVFFEESEVKPGIEHILFDVWKLPRNN